MNGLIFGFCFGSLAMGTFYFINLVFMTDWETRAIEIRK
jgi:hypothetical protein